MVPNPTFLRRAFVDICRRYSIGKYKDSTIYIKHLSHRDHLEYDDLREKFELEAKNSGAPTEEDRLDYLKSKNLWSDGKEGDITRQKDTIQRFEEGKKSVVKPSLLASYDKQIKDEKDKLTKMLLERGAAFGMTAELYAQERLNDHYIISNLFKDKELQKQFFDEVVFEDLPDSEVQEIGKAYHSSIDICSEANIKLLAVQDFFMSYYVVCDDDLSSFFGCPVVDMTYYQIRLGNAARYFKSIMENMDSSKLMPEQRNDPEALERLYLAHRNGAALQAEGKVPTNMSREDMEQLGLTSQMTQAPKTNMNMEEYVKHLRKQRGGK